MTGQRPLPSPTIPRGPLLTYGLSLAALVAALALRWLLDPVMGDTLPLVTLFGAVAAAVWLGGPLPAVLVAGLGYLACAFLFIEPRGSLGLAERQNLVGFIAFLFTGSIIITLGQLARASRRQSDVSREELRTTLASIGDAVIATDTGGCIAIMNPVAESLTGWPAGEAIGRPLDDVFHIVNEETRERIENPVRRVLRLGRVQGLANHTILVARDGTERPIDDSAAPIRCAEGELVGCVLVFRDVTERRRAERVVADARAYAENVVDTVREPLVVLDGRLRVKSASRSFYRTFQVTPEETENRLIYDLGNRQWDIPALRELLEDIVRRNTSFQDYEVEHDFPAIGRRTMLLNARRVDREDNRTGLILLAIEDRTERKPAEEMKTRLAAIVDSSDDAIVSKDLNGIIMTWNRGAERLFGYTAREAVGQSITMLIPADNHDEERRILERLRRGERLDHYETVRRHKDGTLLDVSLTVSPLADSSGRIVGASKVARDITDRKRAEQALLEADRRKDEFLAMLAHELRNPLASISNAVQVLRLADGGDGETVCSVSGILERQVGQMARFVDDLLDVSRITRGKIELRREHVELAAVLDQTVATARPLVQAMEHELRVSVPPRPIHLDADPVRLSQVVGNLLHNACKFMDQGGQITLTAELEGGQAVIRVRDSGIGIAAEDLPRVFDMFMQVDTSLERSVGGLGIGLTLVQNLVRMHGGTVEAHSDGAGRGSEFVVRLPVLTEAPQPPPRRSTRKVAAREGRRILVVDDNQDGARSLALMLELGGHQTQTVHDGLEAIAAAEEFRPDAVLLDIGLPKLDGYEVCRRIRGQPWGRDLVMVAVSGWGQEEDRHRSKEAGFDAHVVKPVDHEVLGKLLASFPSRGSDD